MSLAKIERDKYEQIWQNEEYRKANHSLNFWYKYREHFPDDFFSVLDIGCGTGRYYHMMTYHHGKDAWGVDIAANCLDRVVKDDLGNHFIQANLWEWEPNRRWDLGVCCDVMEHIPTKKVEAVLRIILGSCRTVMFRIATHVSQWNEVDLHLTKQDQQWWKKQIHNTSLCKVIELPQDDSKYINHSFRVDVL